MKVQCPNCKTIMWETTETYDPNIRANGGMVRLLEPWKGLGWATFSEDVSGHSTTLSAEMTCPKCEAALAPSGRLTVIDEPKNITKGFPPCSQDPALDTLGLSNKDGRFDFINIDTGELVHPFKMVAEIVPITSPEDLAEATIIHGEPALEIPEFKVSPNAETVGAAFLNDGSFPSGGKIIYIQKFDPPTEIPPYQKPVFTCDFCGKEFTAKIALAGHKRSHRQIEGI